MLDHDELLRQGLTALKAGDKTRAQSLFAQLIKANPRDEQAWLYLAAAVKNEEEQRYCLERVMAINPNNLQACQGLAALGVQHAETATATCDEDPEDVPLEQVHATIEALHHAEEEERRLAAERAAREELVEPATPLRAPHTPDAEHPARPYAHDVGDQVAQFTIVERAGSSDMYELYIAHQGDPNWCFWLRRSDARPPGVSGVNQLANFEHAGAQYQAMAIAGTTLEFAHQLAGVFSCRFIGRRWVEFARHVGYAHREGLSYQRSQVFSLRNLAISGNGNIAPVTYSTPDQDTRIFKAPEQGEDRPDISADIFALGAAFLYAVGEGQPEDVFATQPARTNGELASYPAVIAVLRKATSRDPTQRYADGDSFADALAAAYGDVIKDKEAAPKKKPRGMNLGMLFGLLITVIVAVVGGMSAMLIGVLDQTDDKPLPSPVAASSNLDRLPPGPLDIRDLAVRYTDEGQLSFRMTKGDQALPPDAQVTYMLFLNEKHVEQLRKLDQQADIVTLGFVAPERIGMYRLRVEISNGQDEEAIYYEPGGTAELRGARAGAMQIDTENYPQLVTYFGVVDQHDTSVKLMGQSTVAVYQDGQIVEKFSMAPVNAAEEPLTIALAIDVSGSMHGEAIATARSAAADFVARLDERDQACLYIFATQVQQIMGCTADHAAVIAAIEQLETIDDTSLYDALATVASDLARMHGRRAVIVLSDGADTTSQTSFSSALAMVRESNIPVYTIGLLSEKFDGDILQQMADEADATYLEAPNATEMASLYDLIDQQLENQYRISFQSLFPQRRQGTIQITIHQQGEDIAIERSFVVD